MIDGNKLTPYYNIARKDVCPRLAKVKGFLGTLRTTDGPLHVLHGMSHQGVGTFSLAGTTVSFRRSPSQWMAWTKAGDGFQVQSVLKALALRFSVPQYSLLKGPQDKLVLLIEMECADLLKAKDLWDENVAKWWDKVDMARMLTQSLGMHRCATRAVCGGSDQSCVVLEYHGTVGRMADSVLGLNATDEENAQQKQEHVGKQRAVGHVLLAEMQKTFEHLGRIAPSPEAGADEWKRIVDRRWGGKMGVVTLSGGEKFSTFAPWDYLTSHYRLFHAKQVYWSDPDAKGAPTEEALRIIRDGNFRWQATDPTRPLDSSQIDTFAAHLSIALRKLGWPEDVVDYLLRHVFPSRAEGDWSRLMAARASQIVALTGRKDRYLWEKPISNEDVPALISELHLEAKLRIATHSRQTLAKLAL